MAAYIRPRAAPVREESTESVPSHKQNQIFSLHSVRSKLQQTQKAQEHEEKTLVFQNSIQAKSMESMATIRDSMANLHP